MLARLTSRTVIWAAARTIGPALPGFRAERQDFMASLVETIPDPDKGPDYFAVGDGVLAKHIVVRAMTFVALCGLPVSSVGGGDRRNIDCPTCKRLYARATKKAEKSQRTQPTPVTEANEASEDATVTHVEQPPVAQSTGEQVHP